MSFLYKGEIIRPTAIRSMGVDEMVWNENFKGTLEFIVLILIRTEWKVIIVENGIHKMFTSLKDVRLTYGRVIIVDFNFFYNQVLWLTFFRLMMDDLIMRCWKFVGICGSLQGGAAWESICGARSELELAFLLDATSSSCWKSISLSLSFVK